MKRILMASLLFPISLFAMEKEGGYEVDISLIQLTLTQSQTLVIRDEKEHRASFDLFDAITVKVAVTLSLLKEDRHANSMTVKVFRGKTADYTENPEKISLQHHDRYSFQDYELPFEQPSTYEVSREEDHFGAFLWLALRRVTETGKAKL